jgi:uncharacterized circularly permuted ATP-grasp superfamily protein
MRTTSGLSRVNAIYRRLDDAFIDPLEFRPDSLLGVPGLIRAYRAGTVAIANAIGTGVADDKAIYCYVPAMIRFYLGEEPLLENVTTYLLDDPEQLEAALSRIDQLVLKPTGESGGKGVVIGPAADERRLVELAATVRQDPSQWIAQEVVQLSTVPTVSSDGTLAARHVDLRPFAIYGDEIRIVPGGLIVNSSRGGGSKDTWVLQDDEESEIEPVPAAAFAPPSLPTLRLRSWTGQAQQQQQQLWPPP